MKTGRKIRLLIEERGLSQGQVARAVGVSAPTVSRWCAGKATPRGDRLVSLAALLGVPPSFLL